MLKKTFIYKTIFFIFLFFLFLQSPAIAQFSDVKDGSWYKEAIMSLYFKGIISGYEDGTYKPDNPVNRVEFIKMLIGSNFTENKLTVLSFFQARKYHLC